MHGSRLLRSWCSDSRHDACSADVSNGAFGQMVDSIHVVLFTGMSAYSDTACGGS